MTWNEDETEASEAWQINATSVAEAVAAVAAHVRFQPHHVEARKSSDAAPDVPLGQIRRVPAT
ncbi:MAG: hypothetical protein KIT43_04295 [Bauldia sp.]|nr:hypothetical protein [Bauldia sp.]MCW5717900.1 hypothetical protein [Bauldia sp.]